jgi:hypothetical protein
VAAAVTVLGLARAALAMAANKDASPAPECLTEACATKKIAIPCLNIKKVDVRRYSSSMEYIGVPRPTCLGGSACRGDAHSLSPCDKCGQSQKHAEACPECKCCQKVYRKKTLVIKISKEEKPVCKCEVAEVPAEPKCKKNLVRNKMNQ